MKELLVLLIGLTLCLCVKGCTEVRLEQEVKELEHRITKALDFDFEAPKWVGLDNDIFNIK